MDECVNCAGRAQMRSTQMVFYVFVVLFSGVNNNTKISCVDVDLNKIKLVSTYYTYGSTYVRSLKTKFEQKFMIT